MMHIPTRPAAWLFAVSVLTLGACNGDNENISTTSEAPASQVGSETGSESSSGASAETTLTTTPTTTPTTTHDESGSADDRADGGAAANPSTSDTDSAETTATSTPPTTQDGEPDEIHDFTIAPGTAQDGWVGARRDVENVECTQTDTGWSATGTVTNSDTASAGYRVYVVMRGPDRQTYALLQRDLLLEPGASAPFDATASVIADGIECLLQVERFAPTG